MSAEVKKTEEKAEKIIDNKVLIENKDQNILEAKQEDINEKEVEELKEEPKKSLYHKIKDQWQVILKLIELLFCIICFALYFQPLKHSSKTSRPIPEQVGLTFLSFNGYMLINIVFIINRCIKEKIPYRISALFSVIACLLFFISAIALLVDRKGNFPETMYEPHVYLARMLSVSIAFAFINGVIFAVDAFYTISLKADF